MIEGKVFKYGDDVNTDVIFPGKYTYTISDPEEMARHALEDLDPGFVDSVEAGDVIVAGSNFGCGSSREQAAVCLREAGVGAVVARSFARIFFRNAINAGLPVLVCPEAVEAVEAGDRVSVDLESGVIVLRGGKGRSPAAQRSGATEDTERRFSFPALPEEVRGILEAGGLIPYTRNRLARGG
jgi:3-isopropylmalate/(R)-2-methylmalate dehydratase small subunit